MHELSHAIDFKNMVRSTYIYKYYSICIACIKLIYIIFIMYMCVHMLQDVPAEELAGALEAPKTSPVFSPKSVENSESPMVCVNYQNN